MDRDEVIRQVSAAASMVKLCCGVANNAAWVVTLDAFDQVKMHRNIDKRMQGGHKLLWMYKQAIEEFHKYERRLIYATENRMFHVDDMSDAVRKKYGNITDRQYYEFWASIGGETYERTKPMITSLWNKYRLSLIHHNIEQPDIVAWAMTAQACLELAVKVCDNAIISVSDRSILTKDVSRRIFSQFSVREVAKAWMRALQATDPLTDTYELDHTEERNIEMGLEQLEEAWLSTDTMYESTAGSIEDYDDVFRTKGEQKKALREIGELQDYTRRE